MEIEDLLKKGTRRQYKSKQIVLYQGEAPRYAYYVASGVVRAYTVQQNGEEKIIDLYSEGDFIPFQWLYDVSTTSIFYYEAFTDVVAYSLAKDDIQDYISKNNVSQIKELIQRNSSLLIRITSLEQTRAVDKIMLSLYYLIFRFGENAKNGEYKINIPLTQSDLARLIGLTRETTATELNRLKRKKIVSYKAKQYTVNRLNLERAMGEDAFTSLLQ